MIDRYLSEVEARLQAIRPLIARDTMAIERAEGLEAWLEPPLAWLHSRHRAPRSSSTRSSSTPLTPLPPHGILIRRERVMKGRGVSDPDVALRRQAKASLKRIQALAASRPSPFEGLSIEEAIERIRAVRDELWQQNVASRP